MIYCSNQVTNHISICYQPFAPLHTGTGHKTSKSIRPTTIMQSLLSDWAAHVVLKQLQGSLLNVLLKYVIRSLQSIVTKYHN